MFISNQFTYVCMFFRCYLIYLLQANRDRNFVREKIEVSGTTQERAKEFIKAQKALK